MEQINPTSIVQPSIAHQYKAKLFNKASVLIEHSQKKHKQFEEFITAFQKRIDAQIQYAKNLDQVSKYLDKFIEPQTTKGSSFVCSAFKVDNEQRSNQARYLADSIRSQIVQVASEMFNEQTNCGKKLEKNIKKLNKEFWYFEESLQRAQTNYRQIDKQSEQVIITKNIAKFTNTLPQQKKIKLIGKNTQLGKKKKQYEKLYVQSVQQYNEFIKIYKKEVEDALNTLESQEEARIRLSSDCMRKLIVCEVSMFKNIEYDVINISKQMETVDPKHDIEYVIKEVLEIKEEKQVKGSLTEKALLIDTTMLSSSLRKVQQQYFSWMMQVKRNKRFRFAIEQRWKSLRESVPEDNSEIQKLWLGLEQQIREKEYVDGVKKEGKNNETKLSSLGDFLFITQTISVAWNTGEVVRENMIKYQQLMDIQLYRLIAGFYIQEYRIQYQVIIPTKSIKAISQIINLLLNRCLQKEDAFVSRNLIGLLFTFYTIEESNMKKLLHLSCGIGNNKLWKKTGFWDASIFESTYEEMSLFTIKTGQSHSQTVLKEKNLIFSQLASFCHYMIMLGVSSKNVRLTVGRYCRLYDMSEEQNKDLSKMITDTNKQFKAMNNSNINMVINSGATSSII